MKTNLFVNRTTVCMKSVILLCMALLLPSAIAGKGKNSQKKVISYVDTSLNGSQKYVLRVDDKPFYMTNVQVRFDKLRYRWNWDIATCERLIKLPHWDSIPSPSPFIGWKWNRLKTNLTGPPWISTWDWHRNIILG